MTVALTVVENIWSEICILFWNTWIGGREKETDREIQRKIKCTCTINYTLLHTPHTVRGDITGTLVPNRERTNETWYITGENTKFDESQTISINVVLDVSLLRLGYPGGGGVRIPMSPVMLAVRPSIKYKV